MKTLLSLILVIISHYIIKAQENINWFELNYSYINNSVKIPPSPNAASFTRHGDFNVSHYTGAANFNIPLFTVGDESLNLPISMNYACSGIKVDDLPGWIGLGWNISAGGVVNRTVVGNPDLINYYTRQSAWWYSAGWIPWTDKIKEHKFRDSLLTGAVEAQPDIYSFNAGSISGRFIIKKDKTVLFENREGLTINLTFNGQQDLTQIQITDLNGFTYTFTDEETTSYDVLSEDIQFTPSSYSFNSAWYLTRISHYNPNEGEIILTYTTIPGYQTNFTSPYALKTKILTHPFPPVTTDCCDDNSLESLAFWNEQKISKRRIISEITFRKNSADLQKLIFTTSLSTAPYSDGNYKIDNIKLYDMKYHNSYIYHQKSFAFIYNSSTNRLTLTQLTESGKNGTAHPPYTFEYETGSLPEPFDNQIDFWGYYNSTNNLQGLIHGDCNILSSRDGNRSPDFSYGKTASLKKVVFPTGGYQQFYFEAHSVESFYVDILQTPCSHFTSVGGLRVWKIENRLKSGQLAEVRTYSYVKTNGQTSGKSLNEVKSVKAITKEHGYEDCNGCNCEDSYICHLRVYPANASNARNVFSSGHVGYSRVEEVISSTTSGNNGKIVYEYINEPYLPQNLVRNGELTVKSTYDNTGKLIEKLNNTYFLDNNAPIDPEFRGVSVEASSNQHMNYTMMCFDADQGPGGNYFWTFPTDNICEASLNFDSQLERRPSIYRSKYNYVTESKASAYSEDVSVVLPLEKIIKYEYSLPDKKVLTRVSTVNSDGLEHIIDYTYDFVPPASYNVPIELVKSTKSGGTTSPRYSRKLIYNTVNGNWKPVTIQERFGNGSYVTIEELLQYNNAGKLLEAREFNNQENTYLWLFDPRMMTGFVQNGKNNEVRYSSFEHSMLEAFATGWITNTTQYVSAANAGATGHGYYRGGTALTNTAVPQGKYILSYFTKTSMLSDITIGTATVLSRKISSQYANGWFFVEAVVTIPIGGQLSLSFASDKFIDELRLYPFDALMLTFTYDYKSNLLISTCDPSGKTMRYEYDDLDRLKGIYNHDNHFVQVNEYNYHTSTFEPNSLVTRDLLVSGQTSYGTVAGLTGANVIRTFNYVDGLGRPIQSAILDNSPLGHDVFTHIEYDNYGRQAKQHLPFNKNNGNVLYNNVYISTALSDQITFYNSLYSTQGATAFTETLFDASPLHRKKGTRSPGSNWQSYPTDIDYEFNSSNDVRNVKGSGFYAANLFYKTKHTDEDQKTVIRYTDKLGQKVMEDKGGAKTYFLYNEFGLLTNIIQPEGSKQLHLNTTYTHITPAVSRFSFIYTYDNELRLASKSIPGTSAVYSYLYDRLDRLVLETNPNGFKTFTKYDILGRAIITGRYTGTGIPSGSDGLYENRTNTGDFYTNNLSFPNFQAVNYTVDYYDDYNFNFDNAQTDDITYQSTPSSGITYNSATFSSNHPLSEFHNFTKGLKTGSKVAVLKNDNTNPSEFVMTYPFYDKFGRTLQTKVVHPFSGADVVWNKYNFPGWPMAISREHKSILDGSSKNQFILTAYTYDHAGRKLNTSITLNSGSPVTVAAATYNELSQLAGNNLGSNTQQVNYSYNIRGWMTDINNVGSCGTDAFSLKLNYETPNTTLDGTHIGCRNGNISSIEWRTGIGCTVNGVTRNKAIYDYFYDNKNRLTKARYGEITGTTNLDNYTFEATYNDNGDLLTSTTRGKNGAVFGLIDNLQYTMSSSGVSRLNSVQDNAVTTLGFTTTASNSQAYTYDNNGNLTGRTNTTFTTLEYNHLNQPRKIIGSGINLIENTYDATAQKWKSRQNGIDSYYFGDIEFTGSSAIIYHPDGRIVDNAGTWEYHYYVKDHLGNTRVVVKGPSGSVTLMQEYHYYPFGMGMDGNWVTPTGTTEKYRYNGKELVMNGLNMYDYGARWYDPAVGRWSGIDPLCEDYMNSSCYTFSGNNPVLYIDPNGKEIINFHLTPLQQASANQLKAQQNLDTKLKTDHDYKEAKRNLNLANKELANTRSSYNSIQNKLDEIKTKNLSFYNEINNLHDELGTPIDVVVESVNHVALQENRYPSADRDVFGDTDAQPGKIYSVDHQTGIEKRSIRSRKGENTISIRMSTESTTRQLAHEFGHAKYYAGNMAFYVNWLKQHPEARSHGGHYKKGNVIDPNGLAADNAEKGF